MVRAGRQLPVAVVVAALLLATACNDPQSPRGGSPGLNAALGLLDTNLTVATTTTGEFIDPDGYTAWVDFSRSQAIGTNDLATFGGLTAGDHVVGLYAITPNCHVWTLDRGSQNPRVVSLIAGEAAITNFDVKCWSYGGLYITTNTTGVDLDTDGYTLAIDGQMTEGIATNGSVTFTEVYEGDHSVALSGVAPNCALSGANPRTVTIVPGETVSLAFSASCVPTGSGSGSLTVTTTTSGSDFDPDGYTLTIDGTASQAIALTDTVTFAVSAGSHPVALSGVASNCTVDGESPRTVAVTADGAAATTFSVTCTPPVAHVVGKGQIGQGSATPGAGVQTFDFDLRANLTGRFTLTDWSNIHATGEPGRLTTDPVADPGTSITAYRDHSNACSDPTRGVEFDAYGREDEGTVVGYTVQLCDNGPEGSAADFFVFFIPAEKYGVSGFVTSGDIAKR